MSKRIFCFLPVAVLCSIATWQLLRAHTTDLTPWKGGGFGMFSTVDQPATRFLKVYLVLDDQAFPVRLPASFRSKIQRVKADPSQKNLKMTAESIREAGIDSLVEWAKLSSIAAPGSPIDCDYSTEDLEQATLRVELWRYRFEHVENEVHAYHFMTTESSVELSDWSFQRESE